MKKVFIAIVLFLFVFATFTPPASATVTVETTKNVYVGSGTTGPFTYAFKIWTSADLKVLKTTALGVESTLVLNTDYTVTGAGTATGGTVTLTTALASGEYLTLIRDMDYLQGQNYTSIITPSSLNNALDKAEHKIQQIKEEADRAFQLPRSSLLGPLYLAPSAGKLIGWDAAGTGLYNWPTTTLSIPAIDHIGNHADNLSTAITDIGASYQLLLINKSITLTGNVVVPANIELWIVSGGLINLNGYTLTGLKEADPLWFGLNTIPGTTDMTAAFQAAVGASRKVRVRKGIYAITSVTIGMAGADFEMDPEAFLYVSGDGINRNITQSGRATYLGAAVEDNLVDGYNLYRTLKITGGNFIVSDGATAISDRIPFLQYIGAVPTPTNPGLQPHPIPLHVSGANIVLNHSSAVGIGVHGGWGTIIENCHIVGYDWGTGISIAPDGTSGNISSHPQALTIRRNNFASCYPISAVKGSCTNSAEDVMIDSNTFHFVSNLYFQTVNSLRIHNNMFVFNDQSLLLEDCGGVVIQNNYFQVCQAQANATHANIIRAQNCSRFMADSNRFVFNAAALNRNGIGFVTNTGNDTTDISVTNLEVVKGVLGGVALKFTASTAAVTFDRITISNVYAPYFAYIVDFTYVTGEDAHNVTIRDIRNLSGDGCTKLVSALANIELLTMTAPQYYISLPVSLIGVANSSTAASVVMQYNIPINMPSATPSVTASGFSDVSNADSITCALNTGSYGRSVTVGLKQDAALTGGEVVAATALVTIDGTAP